MSSIQETKDDSETLIEMGTTIAVIFGVLAGLLILSLYLS